jgi:hypothetical protein
VIAVAAVASAKPLALGSASEPTDVLLDWHGCHWTITCRLGARQLLVDIELGRESYDCTIAVLTGAELTSREEYEIERWANAVIEQSCAATAEGA